MEQIEDKVEALREELRDGRRVNQTGKSAIGYSESADGQTGSSLQTVRRNNRKASADGGSSNSNKRGTNKESERVRPGRRRSSNNGSGDTNRSLETANDTGRTSGGIERVDDIPERIDNELPLPAIPVSGIKKPVGKPRKEESEPRVKQPLFKRGTLSQQEAAEYQEPLEAALVDYGSYADKALRLYTHDPSMPDIWGDLTDLEAKVLARLMIRRGQQNAAAAEVVRNMIQGTDYISAAIIIVPRVMHTAETLRKMPRKKKGGVV